MDQRTAGATWRQSSPAEADIAATINSNRSVPITFNYVNLSQTASANFYMAFYYYTPSIAELAMQPWLPLLLRFQDLNSMEKSPNHE
jgi:hypothetical protein